MEYSAYFERANKLAKACDIGIKFLKESQINNVQKNAAINLAEQIKNLALNPDSSVKRIDSLVSLENQFFISWNESVGEYVDKFWKEIENQKLGYERKDVLKNVLKKKAIKNIFEFEQVTDLLVVAQQGNRISNDEVLQLSKFLEDFEKRHSKKP